MVSASGQRVDDAPNGKSKRKKSKRLSRIAMEFQPDAVEIERRSVPGGARFTLYVVIALIVAAVAWAYLTKVDRIVVAQGKLVPVETPVIVQAAEPSPVREVFVKFGDIVTPGQTLAILDSTFSESDLRKAAKDLIGVEAKIARLKSEQVKAESFELPDDASVEWIREAALFEARGAAYRANIAEINQEIEQNNASMNRNEIMIEHIDERKELLQAEVDRYQRLVDKGAEPESLLVSRKDSLLEAVIQSREYELQVTELEAKGEGLVKRREAYISDFDRQVLEELVEAETKHVELDSQIEKAERMIGLATLKVPIDLPHSEYMVTEAAERTTNSVLQMGEAVFKLIPVIKDEKSLEVEVAIPGKDIGHFGENFNRDVMVKFNAFPYQKYGYATGKVRAISEESFVQDSGGDQGAALTKSSGEAATFRARVQLDSGWRDEMDLTRQTKFYPGMSVTAEINVGERRVIEYFLYPILRNLDSSIREP